MKKAVINYSKSIWFKIENDQMTRTEALVLFALLIGLTYMMIHVLDPYLRIKD